MTRTVLAAVAVLACAGAGAALLAGGDDYVVTARFADASGLRKDFDVKIDGVPVGRVASVELDGHDRAVARLELDDSAVPVGRDARATIRPTNLLGEKYVDLARGDTRRPAPSGTAIPLARTSTPVELDDVFDTLDHPTRMALRTLIGEQGAALAGRGRDLGALLERMPPALDRARALVSRLALDNRALGRLLDESDRVVGATARERRSLGRLVGAGSGALQTLAERRRALAATVRRAPGAFRAARRSLAALEGAALPLAPAARGLRATAPALTGALRALPGFAGAARPTLRTAREVAPTLTRLGRRATPTVRRLAPLSAELAELASASDDATRTFDEGFADLLGTMEGWSRSTQQRDAAGHVFRAFGEFFDDLVAEHKPPARRTVHRPPAAAPRPHAPSPSSPPPVPKLGLPAPPPVSVPAPPPVPAPAGRPDQVLDYLLGP